MSTASSGSPSDGSWFESRRIKKKAPGGNAYSVLHSAVSALNLRIDELEQLVASHSSTITRAVLAKRTKWIKWLRTCSSFLDTNL